MTETTAPFVVSMSDVAAFKRCRKMFAFSNQMGLQESGDRNEAMQLGTDFHTLMEVEARTALRQEPPPVDYASPMVDIARAYLAHKPLPADIIRTEDAYYTKLDTLDPVYLRTTLDLVYRKPEGTIVGRDYKTFEKAPSLDMDLDFQGRLYATVLHKIYPHSRIEFEWEYVRRALGRDLKGKGWVEWTTEERYINVPMIVSELEEQTTWNELEDTVADMLRAIKEQRFYRTELRVGPHSCDSCSYKRLCIADYTHGALSQADIELLSQPRNDGARMSVLTMIRDPRITHSDLGEIHKYYGPDGAKKVAAYQLAHRKGQ